MAILEGIGGAALKSVVGSVAGNIAKHLVSTIGSKLNPTDVEKALKAGIQAAVDYDAKLPLEQHLFFRCEPDFIDGFLADVFKDAGVQEELARPLAKEQPPQVAYLVEAFKKIAQEHPKFKGKLNESLIEPWLKVLADTYFERTGTYLRFKIAQKVYLKQLASRFDDVKFAGVAVEGQEIDKSALLEKIFVMPDVREEMPAQQWLLESPLESALENRQAELLWEQRQRARREANLPAGRTFSAQQLLRESQSHKVVLLGDPGTGKTTLMSYFAVMLAAGQPEKLGFSAETDLLPILIRIRDWARLLDSASLLDYIKIFAEKNLSVQNLPAGFFEYWLEDGRALILLDGLDEVADTGRRYTAVEQIESFLGQFSQNRAAITSRPAGYRRDFFRTDEFPHFSLQLFDDTKIQQFIDNWYSSRIPDPEEAKRRKDSLKEALEGGERIKLLARNPLLLTIIALIHRYEAYLPRQRYKLYDRAVKTLLTAWDDGKEMKHCPLEYLKRDDLERLMKRLAYWIHAQGGTGDKEGGTLIDREELIQKLGEFIADETGVKRYQAEGEAKRFVEYIRERTGLLNEQGQDCYAFAHKTFQEYLAGEEILYQQRDDSDVVLEHIRKYLHNAHWREVLLLVIAQQTPKGATKALQEILRQPTPYEPWLHRNLLFAGICLMEDFKVADASLVEDILRRLVELEIKGDGRVGGTIRSQVFKILCGLNETKLEAQALQLLKGYAERMDEERLLEYRAALGEKEEVIATLSSRLQDEDSRVRSSAAGLLVELGNASEPVIEALLNLWQDRDCGVRLHVALVLSKLRNASEQEIEENLSRLQDKDSQMRSSAARALGQLEKASERVIEALLSRLKDEDSQVRFCAAEVLVKLGNAEPPVIDALLSRLKEDKNDQVRCRAAQILSLLRNASEPVIDALLSRLQQDEDSRVRFYAVSALGQLGNASEPVIEALLSRLLDEDSQVRSSAAGALGELGNASEPVIEALLSGLLDEDSWVRVNAASALGQLGNASKEVIEALLSGLLHKDYRVRSLAAVALGQLGNASEPMTEALLSRLLDEDSQVRSNAGRALVELSKTSREIAPAVAEWIERHQDSTQVGDGINALWDLVTGEDSIYSNRQ